jgi:tripartite-type tricarboxylate transporter receptor subunit TctC
MAAVALRQGNEDGNSMRNLLTLVAGFLVAGTPANAIAQTPEQFYAGRNINVIVPYAPGAYYDLGTRLMARHLGNHVPGRPNIVVQNQPSAGGIGLANRFAAGADNDGTVLGVLQRAVPQYAFVGFQNARFDPLRLTWIGSVSSYANDTYLLALNAAHPATTVGALQNPAAKTRLGSGRSGSANLLYALVARDVLKMHYDMVRGYEGTSPILLAQQRGEVDGLFIDFSTVQTTALDQWRSKKIVPVVQIGRKTRLPDLPDTPMVRELVSDRADLDFLDFAELPFFIALPIAGPAGIPPDRLKALQDGFMALATDQEFLAEAKKMNYEVSPISGEQVRNAITQAAKASQAVKDRFKALVSQ